MASKTLLTLEQFEQLPDDGMRHELDEGELISMPSPFTLHGKVQARTTILLDFAHQRSLGLVVTDTGFRLSHDTVRAPDVSFIRAERANGLELERRFEGAPDLAVEIISPSETCSKLQACCPASPFASASSSVKRFTNRIRAGSLHVGYVGCRKRPMNPSSTLGRKPS